VRKSKEPELPTALPAGDVVSTICNRNRGNVSHELERRAPCGVRQRIRACVRPGARLYEDFVWSVVNTREFVWVP